MDNTRPFSHPMTETTIKILRDQKGKLAVAERLFQLYNTVLRCPACQKMSIGGTFRKNVAGKANLQGERYRRYVCVRSDGIGGNRCGRTLSTGKFIQLCKDSLQVGVTEVESVIRQITG